MNSTETNNDIAWRLLREARLAKPERRFASEAARMAEAT